jgi:hypothetical protein
MSRHVLYLPVCFDTPCVYLDDPMKDMFGTFASLLNVSARLYLSLRLHIHIAHEYYQVFLKTNYDLPRLYCAVPS